MKRILRGTSWGSHRLRNRKSEIAVPRGRPLRMALRSRIFDLRPTSSPSWSSEFAIFCTQRRRSAPCSARCTVMAAMAFSARGVARPHAETFLYGRRTHAPRLACNGARAPARDIITSPHTLNVSGHVYRASVLGWADVETTPSTLDDSAFVVRTQCSDSRTAQLCTGEERRGAVYVSRKHTL